LLAAMLTVITICGYRPPAASASLRVHVTGPGDGTAEHDQPGAVSAVAVSEAGSVSVTLTTPAVAPGPGFCTVIAKLPVPPAWNCAGWVLKMVRSAGCVMVTLSVDELLPVFSSPPPDTVAVLLTMPVALAATLTLITMAGYEP